MLPYQHAERERFDGAGIYCFYPFDSKLVNNKGVFKIGMTTSFDKRTYGYHTYLPQGVYIVAMFMPMKHKDKDEYGKVGLPKYYKRIEDEIFKEIILRGGEMVTMNVRLKGGKTEWIFADFNTIEDVFEEKHAKYGGTLELANLDHLPEPDKSKPYFKGTIKFY